MRDMTTLLKHGWRQAAMPVLAVLLAACGDLPATSTPVPGVASISTAVGGSGSVVIQATLADPIPTATPPPDVSRAVVTLTKAQIDAGQSISALAVDATHVFYIVRAIGGTSGLYRVNKGDGSPELIASVGDPAVTLAIAPDALYWLEGTQTSRLIRLDRQPGSSPAVVAELPDYGATLVADANAMYVGSTTAGNPDSGRIVSINRRDYAITVLTDAAQSPDGLLTDATHVYWLNRPLAADTRPGRAWTLNRINKTGGAITPLFDFGRYETSPKGFALDDQAVYFPLLSDTSVADIFSVPKSGGRQTVTTALPGSGELIVSMSTHEARLYCMTLSGKLYRIELSGAVTLMVLSERPNFAAPMLRFDEASLYWITERGIRAIAKQA